VSWRLWKGDEGGGEEGGEGFGWFFGKRWVGGSIMREGFD